MSKNKECFMAEVVLGVEDMRNLCLFITDMVETADIEKHNIKTKNYKIKIEEV